MTGIGVMLVRGIRSPLMVFYTIALAAFAQSPVAFIISKPWNHMWWYAHLIFSGGFFVLSYGVVRAFHTTRSFSSVYSQEEMMERLTAEMAKTAEAFQQVQHANSELERLASMDSLTGISNRRHFMKRSDEEISRATRAASPLSVLALDLDYFKQVNDRYGHQAGDEVLKAFVGKL